MFVKEGKEEDERRGALMERSVARSTCRLHVAFKGPLQVAAVTHA